MESNALEREVGEIIGRAVRERDRRAYREASIRLAVGVIWFLIGLSVGCAFDDPDNGVDLSALDAPTVHKLSIQNAE